MSLFFLCSMCGYSYKSHRHDEHSHYGAAQCPLIHATVHAPTAIGAVDFCKFLRRRALQQEASVQSVLALLLLLVVASLLPLCLWPGGPPRVARSVLAALYTMYFTYAVFPPLPICRRQLV